MNRSAFAGHAASGLLGRNISSVLVHGPFQHGNNVSRPALGEVGIEHAHKFPAFLAQLVQAVVELLPVELAAGKPD